MQKWILKNAAVPQGDALSILAMNIYMYAGLQHVSNAVPSTAQHRLQSIYMDDRTWTADSPQLLLQTLEAWENFSAQMGLQENPTKTQLAASTYHKQTQLKRQLTDRPHLQSTVASSATVLGCSTAKSRQLTDKEKQRLNATSAIYKRQKFLPVKHHTKLQDQRSLGVSKAAYGWVATRPSPSYTSAVDKLARRASRPFSQGSIYLHNMLEGGTTCLDVVIGTRQVILWLKRKCQEAWTPAHEQISKIANIAQDWLRKNGWQQRRGTWFHPILNKSLQTIFPNHRAWTLKQAQHTAHLCRESWRTQQWDAFLQSGRRESRAIGMWPYQDQRFCHVRTIAQRTEGSSLAVLYGPRVSPACFALRRDVEAQQGICPYCNQYGADHAHVFWHCGQRPPELQQFAAQDVVQARLGWPMGPQDSNGIAALKQMTSILEDIWKARHEYQPNLAGSYQSYRKYEPKGFTLRPPGRRKPR
eukprot:Skav223843  [mRNA]  locus=scaffold2304:175619:183010:- [translate_table: standard]